MSRQVSKGFGAPGRKVGRSGESLPDAPVLVGNRRVLPATVFCACSCKFVRFLYPRLPEQCVCYGATPVPGSVFLTSPAFVCGNCLRVFRVVSRGLLASLGHHEAGSRRAFVVRE